MSEGNHGNQGKLSKERPPQEGGSRRRFIGLATAGALAVSGGALGLMAAVFFKPRVTYGPPPKFRVGKPASFTSGSEIAYQKQAVLVRREGNQFAAISTKCTHLGCTVNATDIGFLCPCHGSTYDRRGSNVSGPAPSPLLWFQLSLAPNGDLVVDKDKKVSPGTFLEIQA